MKDIIREKKRKRKQIKINTQTKDKQKEGERERERDRERERCGAATFFDYWNQTTCNILSMVSGSVFTT